jgi:glycosyltransferase involved in cell wall biosynthesis
MTKPIALDITAIAEMNFTTGVQRVVRQFVAANQGDIEFIRFDFSTNVWRSVPELGEIVVREQSGVIAQARARAEKASTALVENAKTSSWRHLLREIPMARPAYLWLRKFIARNLQAQKVNHTYNLKDQPEWQPRPGQTYLMMDIPIKSAHTWAMSDLFDRKVIRSVVYVHDLFPLTHPELFERVGHAEVRSLHLQYLDAVGRATDVVTNSEFTLRQYTRFCELLESTTGQNRSVVYLPWPHLKTSGRRDDSRANAMFGDATIRVLLIGQLDTRKNFQVVVSAVRELLDSGANVRLGILAGYSAMSDAGLRAAIDACTPEQRSRISIEGIVSDAELLAVYDAVNVVAIPSLAEGYGLPVVEALSRGKRVLVANSTALPELATKFDNNAVTVIEPFDVKGWATAILRANDLAPLPPVKLSKDFPKDWREFGTRLMAKPRRR